MYYFINSKGESVNDVYNSFSFCLSNCEKKAIDGKLQCKCGEDIPLFEWSWQDQQVANVNIFNDFKEVLFHPVYSSGTAAVRGQLQFQQNYHYYWEIKIISKLYGTDFMIGVGTSKVVLEDYQLKFCSLLGIDSESWGYSYIGRIQHDGHLAKYGTSFGLGSIVGVHLDMCNGTLEYFLNRKPLGIAFRGLKGKELYPMVSSTAAKSSMRITCCISKEASLQMMCLKHIMEHPPLYKEYKNIPGLCRIYDTQFFWIAPQPCKEAEEKKRLAELDDDLTLSLVDGSYLIKNKKARAVRLIIPKNVQFRRSVRQNTEQEDGPSTSNRNESTEKNKKVVDSFIKCWCCRSKTHNARDCTLGNLDDSDSDTETTELSSIF